MSYVNKEIPHPPSPPEFKRQISLYPAQAAWFATTLLVILVAMFGAFGDTYDAASAQRDSIELNVRYPTQMRFKVDKQIAVSVRNNSDEPIETLMVEFDRRYFDQFTNVTFTPDAETITEETFQVELKELQPGETQVIHVEIEGNAYWRHEGRISVSIDDEPLADVSIHTFVFP